MVAVRANGNTAGGVEGALLVLMSTIRAGDVVGDVADLLIGLGTILVQDHDLDEGILGHADLAALDAKVRDTGVVGVDAHLLAADRDGIGVDLGSGGAVKAVIRRQTGSSGQGVGILAVDISTVNMVRRTGSHSGSNHGQVTV